MSAPVAIGTRRGGLPSPRAFLRATQSIAVVALVLLGHTSALAQGELPGLAPMGQPPPGSAPPPAPSDAPETHAASGGTETTLPTGDEPTLPEQPLQASKETLKRIGSDATGDPESNSAASTRQFYGLYYNEQAGEYRHRVAFPAWAERTKPSVAEPKARDRASIFGGVYYNRRAPDHADDIFFPLVWNLKNPLEEKRTTVIGPFVNRRTKVESDDWLLPLYAKGKRPGGRYTIVPPLLTYKNRNAEGGLNIVGPGFCTWKGGQSCDIRTAHDISLGLAPFYFFGQDKKRRYEIVPPLGHYYKYDLRALSWTNVWGPYFRRHTEKREMFHLIPLYFSIWGENERHTTVAPLFHYGYEGKKNLLITPLFLNGNGKKGEHTFVTWGYARHRGDTELDMYTPLYWNYRDPRIGLDRHLLLPFYYSNESPRESTTAVVPFFSYKKRHGLSYSLWVSPLFNIQEGQERWSTAVLPAFFFGRNGHERHRVVAPLFFDLSNLRNRTTVVPPLLYVRHRTPDTVSHVFGNIYYKQREYKNGREWQIHLLPLLSYGHKPNGHFWNILFGLAGYTREGPKTKVRVLWIPITLSRAPEDQPVR